MKKSEGCCDAKSLMGTVRARMAEYEGTVKRDSHIPGNLRQAAISAVKKIVGKKEELPESHRQRQESPPDGSILGQLMFASVSKDFSLAADESRQYDELDKLVIRFLSMAQRVGVEIGEAAVPDIAKELLEEWKANVEELGLKPKDASVLTLYQGKEYLETIKQPRFQMISPAMARYAATRRPRDPLGVLNEFMDRKIEWANKVYGRTLREISAAQVASSVPFQAHG